MSHIHAIVWLDHLEATVIGFSLGRSEVVEIHSQSPHRQIHRKSGIPGSATRRMISISSPMCSQLSVTCVRF